MRFLFSILITTVFFFASCNAYKNLKDPEFRDVKQIELMEVGLTQTKAGAELVFYNPNKFNVTLTSATGDVYVEDKFIGWFELTGKVYVKKKKEFVIPIVVKLDNYSILMNRQEILEKKEVMIRVKGMARVSKTGFSKEVPILYEKKQSVDKLKNLVSL